MLDIRHPEKISCVAGNGSNTATKRHAALLRVSPPRAAVPAGAGVP